MHFACCGLGCLKVEDDLLTTVREPLEVSFLLSRKVLVSPRDFWNVRKGCADCE